MSLSANTITPDATRIFSSPFTHLLRNNNPSGNPNAAPRCGAKNRAGTPCRAPAMPNGRCRCHGGKSTGPRTPAGKARSATANLKRGSTTAEARTRQRYIRTLIKRTYLTCQARLLWPYLPLDMANRLAEGPDELWTPIHFSNVPFLQSSQLEPTTSNRRHTQPGTRPLPKTLAAERAAARAETASQAPWRAAIAYARTNKREWLAFRRTARAEKRAARAARQAARTAATNLQSLLPPPETPWANYTPLERELAARLAGFRTHTSEPRLHSAPTPDSSIPRINPVNPERTATPAQNPESAHPRINPVNPEPAATQSTPARLVAAIRQHPQLPILPRLPAHQGQIADHHPGPARAPDGQNAATKTIPTPTPTPDSTLPRINPANPEPTHTPAPNPESTHPRINPVNPEAPRPRPGPARLNPARAQALATTTHTPTWDPDLRAARRQWARQQRHLHRAPQAATRR